MRVLHVTEVLDAAGIESFIMNVYRHIDKSKIQFDFFIMRNKKEYYEDEILSLGGHKFYCDFSNEKNVLLKIRKEAKVLYNFLKNHKYRVVHVHACTPLRALYIKAAKKAGVEKVIMHSHSAAISGKSFIKRVFYRYYRHVITKYATDYFACSKAASKWMYEAKIINKKLDKVIHNGIDTEVFKFNENIRNQYRDSLKLAGCFVLINTGRFTEQKNQSFILEIFKQILIKIPNCKLLLLGDGPLKDSVKAKSSFLEIDDKVIFLGVRNDVGKLLQAADCFIMPSLYEGLPVAGIEAQCSGLPCVFSNNVTYEVKITENVVFLSLEDSKLIWADTIFDFLNKNIDRNVLKEIVNNGYDISSTVDILTNIYLGN